jgi:hypothetical protein
MHATAHPSHDSNKFLYKYKTCMPNGEPPTRICLDGIEAGHQGAVGSLPRAMFSPLLRSIAAAASCRLRRLWPQAADFMVCVVRRAAAAVALPPGAAAPAQLKPLMADRVSPQAMLLCYIVSTELAHRVTLEDVCARLSADDNWFAEEDLRAVQSALGALLDLSVVREVLCDSLSDLKAPRDVLDARRNNAKHVAAQRLLRFLTASDSDAAAGNAHGVLSPWCSRGDDQRNGAECIGALLFEHAAQVLKGSDCSDALSIGKQLEEASELLEASGMSSRKRAVEHFEVVVKAAAEMDCRVVAEIAARIASSAVRGVAGDASDSTSGAGLQPVANAANHAGAAICRWRLSLVPAGRCCLFPTVWIL